MGMNMGDFCHICPIPRKVPEAEQDVPCGLCYASGMVMGRWKIHILWILSTGTKRFGEISSLSEGITPSVLSRQLKELEADGLICRTAYDEQPPRVEYSLSHLGCGFLPALRELSQWGNLLRKKGMS